MADITKCTTKDCPLAEKCYRKSAKDGPYQSYSKFEWFDVNGLAHEDKHACDFFIDKSKRFTGNNLEMHYTDHKKDPSDDNTNWQNLHQTGH